MKLVLLVDDDFQEYCDLLKIMLEEKIDDEFIVIDSGAAHDPKSALEMIRAYPGADFIFLDGYFGNGNCKSLMSDLRTEEIAKVICFSGDPGDFFPLLNTLGVKHFPGKHGRFWLCVAGTCDCACK